MGLDWEKLNQQKQRIQQTSRGSIVRARWWKPSVGRNHIRIMPEWTSEGDFAGQFWREVSQHWNVSNEQRGPVICPKKTPFIEGECPVCDLVEELRQQKDNLDAQEAVKEVRAKTAVFLNIINMDDQTYTVKDVADYKNARPDGEVPFEVGDVKVQVYACPPSVFNKISNDIIVNNVDITSLEKGHDVILTKTGSGLGTRYETSLVITSTPAPAVKDLPDLSSVGYISSKDELLDLLGTGVGAEFPEFLPKDVLSPVSSDDEEEPKPVDADALRKQMAAALTD